MNTALLREDSTPELDQGLVSISAGTDADLLAQMIHDIKNPLSAILCYAEIVAEAKDDERREYCDRLQANARAMLDLLDGFGLLISLRAHDVDTMVESFDWVRQAMRVATDLHPIAAFRSQRIACDSVGDRFVAGDRAKLTVAMRSLLLEALRLGAPSMAVDLQIRATGANAAVQVIVPAERESGTPVTFDQRRPALELIARVAELHHGALTFHADGNRAVATLTVPCA
jgi:signal transduction histidine kinase